MKKMIGIVLLFAACGKPSHDGLYVLHYQNEYFRTDDTLEIRDGVVGRSLGFNPIRNGELKARKHESRRWRLDEPGSPVITFHGDSLRLGDRYFKKIAP
ncbi:hypothetical protein [Mucilaginibacter pedocola]|uniref:Uncharacterized protein n=1 Tax=Mucilaginibacter pedocola TaxID=1792845 RepID=A0A1S9P6P6_9SPHI|nr:hypothetical protein [Mucilaginibacter pedocola]OOQ56626.1 hypothetical protein BC343_19550 [Mucilaginibacter pedocola]